MAHSTSSMAAIAFVLSLFVVGYANALECGGTVAAGETVILTGDLGPCSGLPIQIETGGTLDLGGFTILCDDLAPASYGVQTVAHDVTIRNGTIDGCGTGVSIHGDGAVLENLTLSNSEHFGFETTRDKYVLSNVTATGNGDGGFHVRGFFHKIVDCTASDNGGVGFSVAGRGSKLTGNTAHDNDVGFEVNGVKNKLIENVAYSNILGILAAEPEASVKIVRNNVHDNSGDGIQSSSPAKIVKNTTINNGGRGINIAAAADLKTKITKNTSTGNVGGDMHDTVIGCGAHIWRSNTFVTAGDVCIE